jgi:tetratricopeptide (TPR) repeat protein
VRQALEAGDYEEAERLASEWLARVERDHGLESLATARALDLLVEAAVKNGNAGMGRVPTLSERAVRLKEGHLGPEHVETAQSLYNLGTVHLQRGEFSAALQPLERSLSIRTAAIGLDDPAVADSLDQFALSLIQLDRFQEAEQRLAESQRIRERRRDESSLALARTLELVAWLHRTSGNYAAATSAINRAMALRRSGPRDHPDMVLALQVQGDVLLLTGDASGA